MKKKVLISIYDMEIGGIERSLINMLENFDYSRYNVDLLIFNHTGEFIKYIPKNVNILDEIIQYANFRRTIKQGIKDKQYTISLVRLICKFIAPIKAKLNKVEEGVGYYQIQLALKYSNILLPKIKKEYDIAISYAWPHDITVNKVKAKKKIAWIHTDYSILEVDNKIDFFIWSKFNNIFAVSDECKNAFLKKYPSLENKVKVMENINSPNFIRKMAEENIEENILNDNSFKLVSVARLSHAKGIDNAVKALKILHNKGLTNIKWYVVGYGGDEELIRNLIKENSLEENFILLGKKINPYAYMKMANLYVQPSRYEGKAVTVTEAQILGKPVLITNYTTAQSQLKNNIDGYICDLSVEGIVDGVEKLYLDKEFRNKLSNECERNDYSNSYELNSLYNVFK